MDCSMPGYPVLHNLLEFAQTHAHWVGDAIQPSHHLSPPATLSSVFFSIRVFSNESALHMRWPKYWSFSVNFSNEYSGLITFRIDWLISLLSRGLSKIFSCTTICEHQFCIAQPSLWSNNHIRAWLQKNCSFDYMDLWWQKWCFCFLICCLALS